jgi:hypothetical protein
VSDSPHSYGLWITAKRFRWWPASWPLGTQQGWFTSGPKLPSEARDVIDLVLKSGAVDVSLWECVATSAPDTEGEER